MVLESIKYVQFKGTKNEWNLAHTNLGQINLIVGQNASGKTRTVNIISNLAKLLSGKIKPTYLSSDYSVIFRKDDKTKILYNLIISNKEVSKEELIVGSKTLLKRNKTGAGTIFTAQLKKMVNFKSPNTEMMATRRDSLQYPFLVDLHTWSNNINVYLFGTPLGQNTLLISDDKVNDQKINEIESVLKIFKKGKDEHGVKFTNQVIKDMGIIGYKIKSIDLDKPNNVIANVGLLALYVHEQGVRESINQMDISQGMFRALSLIIQINYFSLLKKSSCIVIDDIGEGLDFERSTKLINLLIEKAEKSNVQLIMSTNDRFVMNNVPLKYWSIIQREAKGSKIYNYQNSKKIFDEFEFTGLNNFDFFAKKFFEKGLKK